MESSGLEPDCPRLKGGQMRLHRPFLVYLTFAGLRAGPFADRCGDLLRQGAQGTGRRRGKPAG